MKIIGFAVCIAALVISKANGYQNCTAEYQATARQLVTLKSSCNGAALYDCCQIFETAQVLGLQNPADPKTEVYTIENVCKNERQSFLVAEAIPNIQARCDMDKEDGGWLIILQRNGSVSRKINFTRSWYDYERGFGDLTTEFWYGLRNIHCLTKRDQVELRIEMRQNDGTGLTWNYGTFRVDGPETNYVLHIGDAQGPAGGHDAMARHNGQPFTTYDRDNDRNLSGNCAAAYEGGWWYTNCFQAQLTGPHNKDQTHDQLQWYDRSSYIYFPHVEMKIRPKKCKISNEQQSCE